MLKNVKFEQTDLEELATRISDVEQPLRDEVLEYARMKNEFYARIKPVRKGYFVVDNFNANHDVIGLDRSFEYEGRYLRGENGNPATSCRLQRFSTRTYFHRKNALGAYGVADTLNQIYEYGQKYAKLYPSNDFVCLISTIVKEEEPDSGGWRYHKWGEFIGKRELKWEYVYDDKEAPKEIYVFHFYGLE